MPGLPQDNQFRARDARTLLALRRTEVTTHLAKNFN